MWDKISILELFQKILKKAKIDKTKARINTFNKSNRLISTSDKSRDNKRRCPSVSRLQVKQICLMIILGLWNRISMIIITILQWAFKSYNPSKICQQISLNFSQRLIQDTSPLLILLLRILCQGLPPLLHTILRPLMMMRITSDPRCMNIFNKIIRTNQAKLIKVPQVKRISCINS